jgi:hypothetical protein
MVVVLFRIGLDHINGRSTIAYQQVSQLRAVGFGMILRKHDSGRNMTLHEFLATAANGDDLGVSVTHAIPEHEKRFRSMGLWSRSNIVRLKGVDSPEGPTLVKEADVGFVESTTALYNLGLRAVTQSAADHNTHSVMVVVSTECGAAFSCGRVVGYFFDVSGGGDAVVAAHFRQLTSDVKAMGRRDIPGT